MYNKCVFKQFIDEINGRKLLTKFIINIFDYSDFHDYNYLFRMIDNKSEIIIDIYDNVSDNRFNRYVFSFEKLGYDIKIIEESNVFVNYISINDIIDCNSNLLRLAYLFKIDDNLMIEYASSFLDNLFVSILDEIIKRPM